MKIMEPSIFDRQFAAPGPGWMERNLRALLFSLYVVISGVVSVSYLGGVDLFSVAGVEMAINGLIALLLVSALAAAVSFLFIKLTARLLVRFIPSLQRIAQSRGIITKKRNPISS